MVAAASFTKGNDVAPRPDVTSSDGEGGVRIVGRAPSAGVDPEATRVADRDFWKKLADSERMPIQMRGGRVAAAARGAARTSSTASLDVRP